MSCPTHLLNLTQNSYSKSYDSPPLTAPVSSEAKRTIVKKKTLEESEWIKPEIWDWVGRCLGKPTISFHTHIKHCYHLITFAEKAMAPHSSTLTWKLPWTEEPGGLQSTGSLRVGHNWMTSLSLFPFMHWRRKWQPTPVLLPEESQGWGAWWAVVYGVIQSQTRLKRLSSSSIIFRC